MLIEFNVKPNLYQNLLRDLYEIEIENKIIYNFIPIKFNDNYFILTSSIDLDGYLMDYRENILVKLYLNDKKYFITLNSVISVNEQKFNNKILYDCYIDNITNLLLIRFYSEKLEYIPIDLNININNNIIISSEVIDIKYNWTDSNLDNLNYSKKSKLELLWNNSSLNLHHVPILTDTININEKLIPITGSSIISSDNLVGIVSYINNYKIIITPLISIKKFLDIMINTNLFYLGIDLYPIKFNFNSELNKINYNYGIMIGNNFYDKKNIKSNIIDDNIDDIIDDIIDDNINDNINITNITNKKNSNSNNKLNLKYLSRKNIICSVDNYKINSEGNLEINSEISIPFKSYIWLFKNSKNNLLNIELISNNIFNFDIIELKYKEVTINDDYIKKKINIINTQIYLDNNYNNISGITLCELKYIKYNNNYIVELNERILKILKPLAIDNRVYSKIFNKIISQRYNKNSNKIILGIKINKDNIPTIKDISGYKNFENLISTFNSKLKIKKFINKNM